MGARTIIITGFMGAGKTTVAVVLSQKLLRSMIDLDRFITDREGRTPQAIIDEDGERRFRELESAALRDALGKENARIIALGGGAWTILRNRSLISEHGCFTVWLDAPFRLCWERIVRDNNSRPLGRNVDDARRLYDERRRFYDQAMLRVEIREGKSADMVVAEIVDALKASNSL
jgi:shikimate kinase